MTSAEDGVIRRRVSIVNERGLHARAAAKFVKLAEQFDAEIIVSKDDTDVPGTSIMGLLMLAAAKGCRIDLRASGREAETAVAELAELVAAGFDGA
jgi:phosphocarrier protein